MSFAKTIQTCLRKYVVWEGRAPPIEFVKFFVFSAAMLVIFASTRYATPNSQALASSEDGISSNRRHATRNVSDAASHASERGARLAQYPSTA